MRLHFDGSRLPFGGRFEIAGLSVSGGKDAGIDGLRQPQRLSGLLGLSAACLPSRYVESGQVASHPRNLVEKAEPFRSVKFIGHEGKRCELAEFSVRGIDDATQEQNRVDRSPNSDKGTGIHGGDSTGRASASSHITHDSMQSMLCAGSKHDFTAVGDWERTLRKCIWFQMPQILSFVQVNRHDPSLK